MECVWFKWSEEENRYCVSTPPDVFADLPTTPYYPVSFL